MLRWAGSHLVHLVMEVVLGIAGVLALAGCFLVWRLAQGPIDITALVQRAQHRLPHVSVGRALLAWEGFHDPDSPLDVRFSDLRVADALDVPIAQFPAGRVTLATAPLWRGAILPGSVVLDGATIILQRGTDGMVSLDLGNAAPGTGNKPALPADLTRPGAIPALADLRLVRLEHATVTLRDAALGVLWRADAPELVLRRQDNGDVSGDAILNLAVGDVQARLATHVLLNPRGIQVAANSVLPVSPAAVARAVPALASLAAIDAPVTAAFSARIDANLLVRTATLSLQAGAGVLHAGRGLVALAAATALLRRDDNVVRLENLRVALAPPRGAQGAAPVLTGNGALTLGNGALHAAFAAALDRVPFADIPAYWPRGTGGGAQPWITQNITAGMAQNAQVTGTLDAAADGSDAHLTALSGSMDAHDFTLHWLRPVPPIEHAEARLVIDGPDVLHIDVLRGMQGPLSLSAGRVRISGLSAKDQFADIKTHIDGALPAALALLNHPRLRLLSRQPFSLDQPSGGASADLSVKLPLDVHATFDDIGIKATAKLSDVHLAAVAAGRDLDGANLDLAVDTNQLNLDGGGRLGGVPARLALMMDFRAGPAAQVTNRVTASGRATAAELATAWLPPGIVTAGDTGFDITYAVLRDATATVVLRLDAQGAAVTTPFGWSKPVGPAANASARLRLVHDRLAAIDAIAASGPGLSLNSHIETQAGRLSALVLDQLRLGRTSARGSVRFPAAAEKSWRVVLRGTALDLSAYLKRRDTGETTSDDATRGPPWQADLAFDHVVLARDVTLAPVMLKAASDGLHYTHLELSAGGSGAPAAVHATIQPEPGGRALRIDATDAGAVLLAAGVADNIRGGRLKLEGVFDDAAPHAPLTGSARLDNFRVTDVPAIGRLLKAMTLYGAGDLLRGPGLGFSAAVVPFGWQQRVLSLHNARAFSASLGVTAQGDIDLRHHTANVTGTIVPAYFFNQLLGKIPLVGKLFSPETGGGVFAARYSIRGPLKDPKVGVNPLSALTPGFLRGVFGIF